MRVLILAPLWPEPASSAGGKRMMDLIRLFLEQNWTLHFASSATSTDHSLNLKNLGIQTHSIALNCDSFETVVQSIRPDLVIFDRYYTEEQFGWRVEKAAPEALRVIETCDLHSLRETRQTLLRKNKEYRLYSDSKLREAMLEEDKTLREIAAIYRSDLSLIISDFESRLLSEQFQVPRELLHTCGFFVDKVPFQFRGYQERTGFVTIGNFLHEPNWDSALWLSQKIWPRIRAQLPKAEMRVYGAYAPEKTLQLHSPKTGFHLMGRAPSSENAISEARVLLSPLRFGAGLKGKLFEALLTGTPSVTTSIGTEGMKKAQESWAGLTADTEQDLIEAAVELYTNQRTWEESQSQAPKLLKSSLKSLQGTALIERLESLVKQKHQHRSMNFTGRMLRHHSLQSTRHLSNWIALKKQAETLGLK